MHDLHAPSCGEIMIIQLTLLLFLSFQISFLLRMIEVVGKHPPINVLKPPSEMSSLEISLDGDLDDAESAAFHGDIDEKEAAARMKIITQFAREVLLSHVKKDVNLSPYPGR